jgi:hypothetical protein
MNRKEFCLKLAETDVEDAKNKLHGTRKQLHEGYRKLQALYEKEVDKLQIEYEKAVQERKSKKKKLEKATADLRIRETFNNLNQGKILAQIERDDKYAELKRNIEDAEKFLKKEKYYLEYIKEEVERGFEI